MKVFPYMVCNRFQHQIVVAGQYQGSALCFWHNELLQRKSACLGLMIFFLQVQDLHAVRICGQFDLLERAQGLHAVHTIALFP